MQLETFLDKALYEICSMREHDTRAPVSRSSKDTLARSMDILTGCCEA